MSLSKIIILVLTCFAITACSTPEREESVPRGNVVVIRINNAPDAYTFSRLEQILLDNSANGFTNSTVFSNHENESGGRKIVEELNKIYAIKSELIVSDAVASIQLQINKYNQSVCYVNQLDDFNWYKSTSLEIREYNQSEICATTVNDRLLRM